MVSILLFHDFRPQYRRQFAGGVLGASLSAFDRGNGVEKAIEAQLCAAFNRGVATEPDKWYTPSQYYKNSVANFYAGFFHEHSVLGKAYGFCYDDVNDQSTLLQYDKADALVIDLKW